MADEITLTMKMLVSKGSLVHKEEPGIQSVTMTGSNGSGGIQNIGTSAELLSMGDTGTAGWSFFRNTDTTNFVELGTSTTTFVAFAKLKAGEACMFRLGTNAPAARANTAAVNLQYFVLTD